MKYDHFARSCISQLKFSNRGAINHCKLRITLPASEMLVVHEKVIDVYT